MRQRDREISESTCEETKESWINSSNWMLRVKASKTSKIWMPALFWFQSSHEKKHPGWYTIQEIQDNYHFLSGKQLCCRTKHGPQRYERMGEHWVVAACKWGWGSILTRRMKLEVSHRRSTAATSTCHTNRCCQRTFAELSKQRLDPADSGKFDATRGWLRKTGSETWF